MNSFVKKGLYCALFVGGLSVLGVGAANAAETSGESGVASGSQVAPDLTAPIVIDGNAISLLGDSSSTAGTADAAPTSTADGTSGGGTNDAAPATTNGTNGTASGTQVAPDINAPVTLDGNAISLGGDTATSGSTSDATATPGADGVLAEGVLADGVLADGLVPSDVVTTDGEAVTEGTTVVSGSALPFIRSLRAFASPLGLDAALAVNDDSTITPDGTPLLGVVSDAATRTEGTVGLDVTVGADTVAVPGDGDAAGGMEGATDPVSGTDPATNGTDAEATVDSEAATETSSSQGNSEGAVVVSAAAHAAGAVPALAVTKASWTEPALTGSAATIMPAAWLANTGTSISPLIALIALFPLMGLALLLVARRKASRI